MHLIWGHALLVFHLELGGIACGKEISVCLLEGRRDRWREIMDKLLPKLTKAFASNPGFVIPLPYLRSS